MKLWSLGSAQHTCNLIFYVWIHVYFEKAVWADILLNLQAQLCLCSFCCWSFLTSEIYRCSTECCVHCARKRPIRFPRLCVDKHDCTDSEHWFKNIQHLQDEHENQLWPSPNCSRDVPEMISCDTHSNCFICFMVYLLLVKGIKIQYIDDILPVIHCTVTQPDLSGLLH